MPGIGDFLCLVSPDKSFAVVVMGPAFQDRSPHIVSIVVPSSGYLILWTAGLYARVSFIELPPILSHEAYAL